MCAACVVYLIDAALPGLPKLSGRAASGSGTSSCHALSIGTILSKDGAKPIASWCGSSACRSNAPPSAVSTQGVATQSRSLLTPALLSWWHDTPYMSSSCHHRPSCPSCPANATNAPSVGGRVRLYARTHTPRFTHTCASSRNCMAGCSKASSQEKARSASTVSPTCQAHSKREVGRAKRVCVCVWECIVTRWTSLFLTNRGRCSSKYQNSCAYSDASSFSSPLQEKKRCQSTLCHYRVHANSSPCTSCWM